MWKCAYSTQETPIPEYRALAEDMTYSPKGSPLPPAESFPRSLRNRQGASSLAFGIHPMGNASAFLPIEVTAYLGPVNRATLVPLFKGAGCQPL